MGFDWIYWSCGIFWIFWFFRFCGFIGVFRFVWISGGDREVGSFRLRWC